MAFPRFHHSTPLFSLVNRKVTMANDTWSSSVVKQELNPVWCGEQHDFVVFDQDQHMAIEVLDEVRLHVVSF